VIKKKYPTKEDKKDWLNFTKNLTNIEDKDIDLNKDVPAGNIKKLDLHGYMLSEANDKVKKFINQSYEKNYKKLLIITGKGLRSKAFKDPYRSNEMSILKNSIPDFIKNDKNISRKIIKISAAKPEEGGDGAFYIFLKNKFR
jgi:DNA-nicking Smr family endonuclease